MLKEVEEKNNLFPYNLIRLRTATIGRLSLRGVYFLTKVLTHHLLKVKLLNIDYYLRYTCTDHENFIEYSSDFTAVYLNSDYD